MKEVIFMSVCQMRVFGTGVPETQLSGKSLPTNRI